MHGRYNFLNILIHFGLFIDISYIIYHFLIVFLQKIIKNFQWIKNFENLIKDSSQSFSSSYLKIKTFMHDLYL